MKRLLPSLTSLAESERYDGSLREMAVGLRVAIATHGVVQPETTKHHKNNQPSKQDLGATKESLVSESLKHLHVHGDSLDNYTGEETIAIGGLQSVDEKGCDSMIQVLSESSDVAMKTGRSHCEQDVLKSDKDTYPDREETVNDSGNLYPINAERPDGISMMSKFQEAMQETRDVLIPVQGHGMIALRRLIESRDEETLRCYGDVLARSLEMLPEEDTYIYLGAVNVLAALADYKPTAVLPHLLDHYANLQSRGQKVKGEGCDPQLCLKLGEVILKTTRKLGEITPHYRDRLLVAMLSGAKDADPLVRASAVSNLGEVAKLLRFAIGACIHEVFECVSSLLKSDPDSDVRKAAAMVTTLLLQGLAGDSLKVLESVLQDLYRLLKFVVSVERDELVKVHAQLALDELDSIMRDFLFPKQSLTMKIRVLDAE